MLGLLVGVGSGCPAPLWAQEAALPPVSASLDDGRPEHVTKQWTVEDGLPLNAVWTLEQTPDGMLWVGTLDGLARFDGHSFTTYTAADTEGLAGNRVFGLHRDGSGALWIGTSTGVSIYRDGQFRTVGGASGHVEHFGEGPDGTVWMGGRSGLHRAVSTDRVTSVSLPRELQDGTVNVAAPQPNSVWVASGDHLRLYRDGQFQVPERLRGKVENRVTHLATSPTGTLWVATETQLFAVREDLAAREDFRRSYAHDGKEVAEIRFGPSGAPWVATEEAGLLRVTEDSLQRIRGQGVLGSTIRGLVRDASGQWWVGDMNDGLVRLRPRLFGAAPLGTSIGARGVYADHEGGVWAGIGALGLFRFTDTTKTQWTAGDGLPGNVVRTIHQDETGAIWVGTNQGLARQRGRRFEEVRTDDGQPFTRMSALERDSTGILWIASLKRGLYRYRDDTLEQALPADSLFSSRVLGLMRAQDGALWIGTQQHGVARWAGGTLTWYDGDDGVPYKSVRDVYQTDDGTIWISTSGGGIARFEGDRFTAVTPEDGLPHRSIHLIREAPEGVFWMTSNGGVFRVRRSQVEAVADGQQDRLYAQAFGIEDGMPARECNGPIHPAFAKDEQGNLWIPTVDGLTVVDSGSPQLAIPDSLPVHVTGIRADGQSHPLDSLALAPATYRVALDFSATTLRHAGDLSFRYRLDEEAWTPAHGRRTAEFTTLEAGTHRFEVQATIDGETWYTLDAPFRFTVLPHFYETWWFRVLLMLSLLGLGVAGYRWRTYRLRKRQEKLEEAVETRTEELQKRTEELEKAKETTERQAERLQELDEAKSRFFARVSHEFRTPLSLIFSPLRDAARREEGLAPEQVGRMLPSAERLRRLIDRLLDLASLEAGGMELERTPGDLAALVGRTAEAFRSEAERGGIALRIERPDAGLPTQLDAEKVETIVSNLLANALKHTPEGGTVTVRLRRDAAPAPVDTTGETAACIEVADTGPGIPEAEQERIFDQFAQADAPRESGTEDGADEAATDGLGLGLALTQELAKLHGGTIDLESVPGEGSTFRVWLPLLPADEDEMGDVDKDDRDDVLTETPGGDGSLPEGAGTPAANGSAPSVRTGGAEVLVVEDNDDMRRVLCTQLSTFWTVREAASAEEAWDELQETPPDLVLSDVMMPGTGGFELCEKIKADPDLRAIPVVLLTARTAEEDTLEGLECGADDYVAKPFDPAELASRLDNHLTAREHLRERHRSEVRVEPIETVVDEEDLPFVEEVIEAVEARLSDPGLTVARLAEAVALSRRQLTRRLKDAVGQSPAAFLRERRTQRAKDLLAEGPETIAEVAYAVGFRSPSAFSKRFREETGRTPSEYVEQQQA